MQVIKQHHCFGGTQWFCQHTSTSTNTDMRFAVFCPQQATHSSLPVLWFLSGLTCTEENVIIKAGLQRFCAEHQLILVAPDTSPRGCDLPGEHDDYDFGSGAGFYVDATQAPWNDHYQMYSYITEELPTVIFSSFNADARRQGITGHSMGGHGALTIALKNPQVYRSVSAFAPICAPMHSPWGQKALHGYLGDNPAQWQSYDAVALIKSGKRVPDIFIDQGADDEFLDKQLKPERLQSACDEARIPLTLRMQAHYDHSYFFIQSFAEDHVRYHAKKLHNHDHL